MKKIFYLATCDTCKRIMKELGIGDDWEKREIKSSPVSELEIDELKRLAGSYEALFSKRSRQYAAMGLKDRQLSESDLRTLILNEYTFLKRPVIIINDRIYIGNQRSTVDAVKNDPGF